MVQCLYTDANEGNISAVTAQISVCDLEKNFSQQQHGPLGFCGHKFTGSELNWLIVEKEGFAVFDALNYLLMNEKNHLDYLKITRICYKYSLQLQLPSQLVAQKLQRWAIQIQRFNYDVHYITDADNLW